MSKKFDFEEFEYFNFRNFQNKDDRFTHERLFRCEHKDRGSIYKYTKNPELCMERLQIAYKIEDPYNFFEALRQICETYGNGDFCKHQSRNERKHLIEKIGDKRYCSMSLSKILKNAGIEIIIKKIKNN